MINAVSDYKLTKKQEDLALQLSRYSPKIVDTYHGAIHALNQNEYSDRLVHFAHSLREVINLLSRNVQTEHELDKSLDKKIRKQLLQSVIDPLGKQSYSFSDKYDALIEEYNLLSSVAHHKEEITNEQAQQKLTRVEDILHMFTRPQLSINDEIDEIISKSPSSENAKRLTELQFRWATQSQLIEKLPQEWLPYMIEVGFFSNPPAATFSKNSPRYVYWAASRYLTKCVSDYPNKVTEVILDCNFQNEKDRNPTIYTDFLTCALDLPLSNIEKIGQKILDEKWYDFREDYGFTEKYVKIIEELYLAEKYDLAEKLFHNGFAPKLSEKVATMNILEESTVYREVRFPMDDYWFEEILQKIIPQFVEKNPELITKTLISLLEESIILDNQGKEIKDEYEDGLEVYRSTIEDSDQNGLSTIKSVFVTHIRNCLIYIANNDPEKLKDLMQVISEKKPWIFRRLELYMYENFSDLFPKEIPLSALKYFRIHKTHHEYYNFIKSVFGKLDSSIQKSLYKKIDDGYDSEKFDKIKDEEGEEIAKKREKYYRLTELEPIKENLDEPHALIYQELVRELGELDHPQHRYYHSATMIQPEPEPKLFEGKTIEKVFEEVKNYIPQREFSFEDTVVITFREFAENNSMACSERCLELKNAHYNILHELFSGFKNAIKDNKKINWETTIQLIQEIVTPIKDAKTYRPKPYDYMPMIYSLIEEGLKTDGIHFELQDKLWKLLEILVEIGTFTNEQEDYPESNTDSLNMSINNLNGLSFHVIYQYAIWYEKHSESKRVIVPKVKKIFDDYLDKKLGGHTVSRHAVLGVNFPNFYYFDGEWARSILEKIISSKNTKIAFWEGYVSWNRLYRYVFADLYSLYNEFLNKDLIRNLKRKHAFESTITHMSLAYFYNLENADEAFERFLETAEPSAIEHCVFHIGTILNGDKIDEKFNKEKFAKLWSYKSIQNHSLERWFRNSPLEKEKTISLYLEHLKNFTGQVNLATMTLEGLNSYSNKFPLQVAECIELLVAKRANDYIHHEVKDILKKLIDSKDDVVYTVCKRIIEQLAILGLDYRDLL